MADAANRAEWQAFSGSLLVYASPNGTIHKLLRAFNAETVDSTATVDMIAPATGTSTPLGIAALDFTNFGLWVKCTGSPNITVKLLQSWDNVSADYAVPEAGGSLITITDTSPHVLAVTPPLMPWLRLRLVGGVGNGAATTVTAYLIVAGGV